MTDPVDSTPKPAAPIEPVPQEKPDAYDREPSFPHWSADKPLDASKVRKVKRAEGEEAEVDVVEVKAAGLPRVVTPAEPEPPAKSFGSHIDLVRANKKAKVKRQKGADADETEAEEQDPKDLAIAAIAPDAEDPLAPEARGQIADTDHDGNPDLAERGDSDGDHIPDDLDADDVTPMDEDSDGLSAGQEADDLNPDVPEKEG